MTTQESYVKLTINSDGKVQPEIFLVGEPTDEFIAKRLKDLIDKLESKEFNFEVAKSDETFEIKQMSGWKQITVRGSNSDRVVSKFNDLSEVESQ